MAPRGVAHSQISGFWRGCRFVIVSGSRWVLSLWLFYIQASVSWTWCKLQLVASAGRQREVWHGPFWVRWRPTVPLHSESSVKVWLCMMKVQLEMTRAWTRSCAACSVRKGPIFLMLCSANLQDRAFFAMCSLKVSCSSKITPRFLISDPCRDVRQAAWDPCSYRWIIWSKWEIELCVISIEMVGEAMCLYDGSQWCSVCGEEQGSTNRSLRNSWCALDSQATLKDLPVRCWICFFMSGGT